MVDETERPGVQRSAGHGQQLLTIVRHDPGHVDVSWVRFLLGAAAGEVVDDPERAVVKPYSVVLTAHPQAIRSGTLARIRRTGTVGLIHVGDRRYRDRLDAYRSFAFVWRTYLHSSLIGLGVRQLPLGPTVRSPVTADPRPEAARPPRERTHTWSYTGRAGDRTVAAMLKAFGDVPGGHPTGAGPGDGPDAGAAAAEVLADTVLAPCPMQGGHLETSRLYDALEVGAVPIVERRRWLDYFALLFGEHPLPTVRHWKEGPALARSLTEDPQALLERQKQVVAWWTSTKHTVAAEAWQDVAACLTGSGASYGDSPLERPPPRWRGRIESLRHHNRESLPLRPG